MNKLLYEPENSLIKQSYEAREIEEPLNGDGFGVAWYARDVNPEPAVFVSISPAWNNRNLKYIAPRITSDCIVAHVRAASVGDVNEANCHPFHYKNYLMMHNGGVEMFDRIIRSIRDNLSDDLYAWIKGQTDSEHLFALFLEKLRQKPLPHSAEEISQAMEEMFLDVVRLMKDNGITDPAYMNMAVTNGELIVASRYVTDPNEKELTLHHSEGSHFVSENGRFSVLHEKGGVKSVLVTSEKLTENEEDWRMIPPRHFIIVDQAMNISFRPINI